MGNNRSSENIPPYLNYSREIFITVESHREWPEDTGKSTYNTFLLSIKYQRYYWKLNKRFQEIIQLDEDLYDLYPEKIDLMKVPKKYPKIFWEHNDKLLKQRERDITNYLQRILDDKELFNSRPVKDFLGIGETSFHPLFGRKGKEGYIEKCSGGYVENYSSRTGDFIKTWRRRWLVLHDNFIAYYKTSGDVIPLGCFHLDQKLVVSIIGKFVTISNQSRKLSLRAETQRQATEWADEITTFYASSLRRLPQPYEAHFPPRLQTTVQLFSYTKYYFHTLALSLLKAQDEILIASWMISPTLLLTRPPLPSIRLDQILQYKANQGVKIFILLYKEVEISGLGNDSFRCKNYLESLHSRNIYVIRHPNKLIGGSTAILWSHHEKIVVIDRKISFVGGVDPCFGRWDDESHDLTDLIGLKFPGRDYYQPGQGLFNPLKGGSESIIPCDDGEHLISNKIDILRQSKESSSMSEYDTFNPSMISTSDAVRSTIQNLVNNINVSEESIKMKIKSQIFQLRELYPRMPWHDVQVCVTGLPARDIAAHFVQRWNHHRASKSEINKPILVDTTDNPYFSVCAKCGKDKISESLTNCQECGYYLGPTKLSITFRDNEKSELVDPKSIIPGSYIIYEFYFEGMLGCRIQGDGPVIVSEIVDESIIINHNTGNIINVEGNLDYVKIISEIILKPTIGDIIISIQDQNVTNLNSAQINRMLTSLRNQNKNQIKILFRRYYVENHVEIIKHNRKVQLIENVKKQNLHQNNQDNETNLNEESKQPTNLSYILTNDEIEWDTNKTKANIICKVSTELEILKSIVELTQESDKIIPDSQTFNGSCIVQVLRSVGPWSIGHSRECSIQNCWVDCIQHSKHFIYIENQFFIGDLVGSEAKNLIPRAILERILLAFERKENFKVIVLLPYHPEGDFTSNSGTLGIMNYQYRTISRGSLSLLEQFRLRTSGKGNPFDYICFCSLRTWGKFEEKLSLEQIYVHDKLLIVDDRIVVIGSANINDRSMLGDRDSEIAIRIEDTNHTLGCMNGEPWTVGVIPHQFRKTLMKQHLGNLNLDLTDPVSQEVYQDNWLAIARSNSNIFNNLDGACVYEKCSSLDEYRANLRINQLYPDIDHPNVSSQLEKIQGNLVLWPLKFLENEIMPISHSVAKEIFV